MNRRIAVLRPEPGNQITAVAIEARGREAIRLPLFEVQPVSWDVPDPAAFDALILTSANAVRHGGAGLGQLTSLPVHAVGEATAEAARAAGFTVAETGTAGAAELIEAAGASGVRRALHLAGRERTLEPGGIVERVVPVYASEPCAVSREDAAALSGSVALVQSARAALRLGDALDTFGIARSGISLIAASSAIAAAAGDGWEGVTVASSPGGTALIDAAVALAIDPAGGAANKGRMSDEPLTPEPVRTPPARTNFLIGGGAFLGGMILTAGLFQLSGGIERAPVALPQQAVVAPQQAATAPQLPAGTDIATLGAREQQLAARLDQLELRLRDLDGSARSASAYASRAERLLIVSAVRRALERGQPLGALEAQLQQRFGETHGEAVSAIVRAAAEPVTLEELRVALDAIAPRLAMNPEDSLWHRFRRVLGDVLVVRQAHSPSPRTSDRLRRARRALDQGDAEAALAEIVHMPGATSAESWVTAAKRYVAARQGLLELEAAALQAPAATPLQPAGI